MESNEDDFFGEQGSADDAALRERQWAALRKEHMKAGFREGSKLGHEAEMQTGFDAGFHAGAKATADAGFWLGVGAVVEAFYRKATGKLTAASPGDSEVVQSDVSALKEERARLEAAVENITDGEAAPDASALRKACENIIVLANQS